VRFCQLMGDIRDGIHWCFPYRPEGAYISHRAGRGIHPQLKDGFTFIYAVV
jgi:hypothetical protein